MALNHNFYNQDMMPIQDSFDEETSKDFIYIKTMYH